ncbi:hypothetical protein MFIFM68171_06127 [Madurella fahalii]|uniref:Uncharacterized protein n=1 Tax=Madurella fahalii TaxID=1157608 RepID=A0ABQ0GDT8_9PEZI
MLFHRALLLALAAVASSGKPTERRLPSWAIEIANATYTDELLEIGKAVFTLTHMLIDVAGTPVDPELNLHFQVNGDIGWVTFNKTWACPQTNVQGRSLLYGYGEWVMKCPARSDPKITCTGLTTGTLLVRASIKTESIVA